MSQNDFTIANQSAPDFRSDLNDALQALASLSSGATAPSTTFANMLWYDTTNNILKMRSEADDAWINIGYLDQSANAFRILDDTQVVNTSGTQTGLIGDQATATWEAGTSTTESLVSPAKVKAASGLTLLGTLTTNSGTTQTLSGLDLTNYKYLYGSVSDVRSNGSSEFLRFGGVNVGREGVSSGANSPFFCDLRSGGILASFETSEGDTGYRTSTTSVSFAWVSGDSFASGTIKLYGGS